MVSWVECIVAALLIMGKWLNCIFSITSEVMSTIFGIYDHLMIVYPVYMFDDQWLFCLVAMATLKFFKKSFLNDTSKTTEAVRLQFAWLRTIPNSEKFGNPPLGLVAMATESFHKLINGKWFNCTFSITSEVM